MLKFLIILMITAWLLFKLVGFVFKILFLGIGESQHPKNAKNTQQKKKVPKSNLNIEYDPTEKKDSNKGFKGGEYIDYEEVK